MLTSLIFVVGFVFVALFVYMARFSGRLRVEEKRLIAAPIAEVYARVADLRVWNEWCPWLEHDPQAKVTLSGDTQGKGGCFAWDSDRIGAGEVEHVSLIPQKLIKQRIISRQPFRFHGLDQWTFNERDGKTEVTWAMKGRVGFALRAFAQTVRSMIALDYRYGLDRLARLVEPAAGKHQAAHYSLDYLGEREVPATRYMYRTYSGSLKGVGDALRAGFAALRQELASIGEQASGEPISVYVKTNIKLRTTVCHMGLPVADPAFAALPAHDLPAHRAYVVLLKGSHAALEIAWYQAMQRLRMDGLHADQRIAPFERYLNDLECVPENEQLIELHLPIRKVAKPA
jgi:hypothetical protein